MQLGRALREVGGRAQGWQPTQRALHYAEIGENPETLAQVQLGVAETHLVDGEAATALAICQIVLQQPDLKASLRRRRSRSPAASTTFAVNWRKHGACWRRR